MWKLAQPGTSEGYTRTSAIGPNISITHLILPTAPSHVFDRSLGIICFVTSSAKWRAKRGSLLRVGNISSGLCCTVLPDAAGWRCDGDEKCSGVGIRMRPGMVFSSAGESSTLVGITGRLLYKFRFWRVMLTVIYRVTSCVGRAASPTSFSRTQGISAREMFN